jgi:lipocalin
MMASSAPTMLCALLALEPVHAFLQSSCVDVQPVENLDIAEYTRASWYVQEQQINSYQREGQLNCVVATYDAGTSSFWQSPIFFDGVILSVYNSYEDGRPTIDADGKPINRLCASVPDTDEASKLLVAPCFLPTIFGGNYWVIGFNTTSNGEYEWAVVSGGPPKNEYPDGCTTGTGYFDSGLWIFSRKPILPEEKLVEARELLTRKGYTLQLLKKVRQTGCSYANAYIKH